MSLLPRQSACQSQIRCEYGYVCTAVRVAHALAHAWVVLPPSPLSSATKGRGPTLEAVPQLNQPNVLGTSSLITYTALQNERYVQGRTHKSADHNT